MDDRRYEVFVSSTFFDLVDERAAVSKVLLEMDAFPSGMELFPATDADSWTLIQQVIDSADYYLLIVGGRYGSIDDTSALSYTEKEYDYAVSMKKPVMAFLHGEPGKIERDKSEMDPEGIEKLDHFRNKVEGAKHVKFWTSKDQLAGQVATSYASFRKMYPAVGWIRGDSGTTTESLKELNDLRKHIQELEAERDATRRGPPPGTEDFVQGTEPAELQPVYEWNGDLTMDEEGNRERSYVDVAGTLVSRADIVWDAYFSAVGPLMFDEASEGALKRRISEWLSNDLRREAVQDVTGRLKGVNATVTRTRRVTVSLDTDDFGTLIVQLRALDLIQKSSRTHGVKDKEAYWCLTPWGEERLTLLRAKRRTGESRGTADAQEQSSVVLNPAESSKADS